MMEYTNINKLHEIFIYIGKIIYGKYLGPLGNKG